MSTATPPAKPTVSPGDREISIYDHTKLFYWWPIWALSFLFAIMTWYDGQRMAIVPSTTRIEEKGNGIYNITADTKNKGSKPLDQAFHRQGLDQDPFKVHVS